MRPRCKVVLSTVRQNNVRETPESPYIGSLLYNIILCRHIAGIWDSRFLGIERDTADDFVEVFPSCTAFFINKIHWDVEFF